MTLHLSTRFDPRRFAVGVLVERLAAVTLVHVHLLPCFAFVFELHRRPALPPPRRRKKALRWHV